MSASTLRSQRDIWLWAAREALWQPHADQAPQYVLAAKRLHRQLLKLQGGAA
jgi:hypothetical protein